VRLVALVATLLWVLVVTFTADFRYGGDIRALLCVGEETHHPAAFGTVPTAGPWGYDGQQYAALATDPFLRDPDTTESLDAPSYRATRIMVPLLAWLLALGNSGVAIVAYQLLCWGLGLAAIFLVARWLAVEGHSPWWALLLVTSAGLAAAMIRSTPDTAALFFMLAALWFHVRRRFPLALVLASAAVLARETSYLVALAIALDELRRRRFASAVAFALVPLAFAVGWQLYLRRVLGAAFATGTGNFSLPFVWLPVKLPTVFVGGHIWWMEFLGLCAVAATVLAMVVVVTKHSSWAAPELAFLGFGAMGLFLSYNVYGETWAYARALVVLPFLAVPIAGRQSAPLRRWTLLSVPILYLLSGAAMTQGEVREALEGRTLLAALRGEPVASQGPSSGAPPGVPVASARPLYVLPVANAGGRAGAVYQTRLEVANLAPIENRVRLELFPSGTDSPQLRKTLILKPGQTLSWQNAVDELFSVGGAGALRLLPRFGPITARSLTVNVAAGAAPEALLEALTEADAIHTGVHARLSGLVHDPAPDVAVRTNIGLLNLAPATIIVRVEPYARGPRPLGRLDQKLGPGEFLQIDDVYAKVKAGNVTNGSAVVQTPSRGGAFLAYASVIRGPAAPVVYVFPDKQPAAKASTHD
jgi:hypothetical protein